MTDLHDAAQEAVWAWEFWAEYGTGDNRDRALSRITDAMNTLREALTDERAAGGAEVVLCAGCRRVLDLDDDDWGAIARTGDREGVDLFCQDCFSVRK